MAPHWTPKESCIAFYFISRGFVGSADVASGVIHMRFGTTRSAKACESRVQDIRNSMEENPYDSFSKTHDLAIVDHWLSQHMNKGELEDKLGIKGNEIVDVRVLELVKKYLPPV